MKRKIIAILCVTVLVVSLFGCTSGNTNADYAGKTLVVKVTSINDGKYTASIGELKSNNIIPSGDFGQNGAQPGMPSGDASGQGNTPPVVPGGDIGQNGTPPVVPSGDFGQNGTPPVVPGGDFGQNGTFPSMPGGENGQFAPDMNGGGMFLNSFTATEGSVTFQIDDDTTITKKNAASGDAASASDIAIDSILEITFEDSGKVNTIVIVTDFSSMGNGGFGGGFGGAGTVTNGTTANS